MSETLHRSSFIVHTASAPACATISSFSEVLPLTPMAPIVSSPALIGTYVALMLTYFLATWAAENQES